VPHTAHDNTTQQLLPPDNNGMYSGHGMLLHVLFIVGRA
jgi:hypothetical protein